MVGKSRRAEDAVTFAAQIFRREPAFVPRRPKPDEFADGIEIGGVAEKLIGLFILRGRLKPVAIGSMKTRSVACKMESSLSTRPNGGLGIVPSSIIFTRRGPSAPRCSHADDAPGPPLKQNVTGCVAALVWPARVKRHKKPMRGRHRQA
jgi:hypothetical protein